MLPVSVCIIAKNEEAHIEECCRRLQPYGFEIVLADTGSTDNTVNLARKYTDKIYHFDWCDDFSAAKNFVFAKASHDWILSIDCDEYLESYDQEATAVCMETYPDSAGRVLIRNRFTDNGQTAYERVRISRFVNRNFFHFTGAIHEQLEPIEAVPKKVFDVPLSLLHVGYDGTEEELHAKSLRNINLLKKELRQTGADSYLYFQLGQSYKKIKDLETACHYFDLGLSMDIDPSIDYVQTMVETYGYTLLDLKRSQDALNLCNVYEIFDRRADFVFLMGLIYMNNALFDKAINEFKKATTMAEFSIDGVNSYKAYYNIGVIYECTNHAAEAKKYYQKCGDYEPAQKRLAVLP